MAIWSSTWSKEQVVGWVLTWFMARSREVTQSTSSMQSKGSELTWKEGFAKLNVVGVWRRTGAIGGQCEARNKMLDL